MPLAIDRGLPRHGVADREGAQWKLESRNSRTGPRAAQRHGRARVLAGLPTRRAEHRQGAQGRKPGYRRRAGSPGLVSGDVRAERDGGPVAGLGPCPLSQWPSFYPQLDARPDEQGGGTGCHASLLRSAARGGTSGCPGGARAFYLRLYPSLHGRQRAHGTISHEHDGGGGRLSLDGYSALGTQEVHGRARKSERRGKHRAVRGFPCQACQGSPNRFAVACDSRVLASQTLKTFGQFRVHVLYKRPEIPANTAIPAFAVSVTYRKQEELGNPGSIPVSATMFSYSYGRQVTTSDDAQRARRKGLPYTRRPMRCSPKD